MLTCQSCFRSTALVHTKQSQPSSPGYAASREEWLQSRGKTPAHKLKARKALGMKDTAIKKHLVFLKDPLKLAHDIRNTLRQGKFEEAQDIVRAASKDTECIVSWNHLIDWQMSQGKVNGALKTYNEMKKRAQHPDSRTFTILFRGFAVHTEYPHALEKALSIYHSMWLPTSQVKPNNIHTNAMLKVCARAGDIDALFTVAAKLPSQGFGAADNLTFTIILNALREHAIRDTHGGLTDIQKKEEIAKNIINGRRLWDDIIARWRKADIFIDEDLACSMGRLLLTGKHPKDWDDIFSLVQQTMKIPRPFERLGTLKRDRHEPSRQSQDQEPDTTQVAYIAGLEQKVEHNDEFQIVKPPPANHDGNPRYPPRNRDEGNGGYVRPGTNALSLVMEAMRLSSMKSYAKHYWDVFTLDHKVKPDRNNYVQLLRVFRSLRASSEALEVLMQMDKSMLERKMLRIALSTCERDKLNPHAFANAGKMLDLMQQHLPESDCLALHSYLCVAMSWTSKHTNPTINQVKEDKLDHGRQIVRALHRLQPSVVNIKSYLAYGGHQLQGPDTIKAQTLLEAAPHERYVESALELFTRMMGAYDKLIRGEMIGEEKIDLMKEYRSIISAYVNRFKIKLRGRDVVTEEKRKKRTRRGGQHYKHNDDNVAARSRAKAMWISRSGEVRRPIQEAERPTKLDSTWADEENGSRGDHIGVEDEADRVAAERVRLEMGMA